jgi:integrase
VHCSWSRPARRAADRYFRTALVLRVDAPGRQHAPMAGDDQAVLIDDDWQRPAEPFDRPGEHPDLPFRVLPRRNVETRMAVRCRRGEVLALRWKDVNWNSFRVSIERSVEQTKRGSLRFKSLKTKKERRNVSISPWLLAELRAHRTRQQELRLSLGVGRASEDSLMFARWDGATRAPHWLTQRFALVMGELKIDCTVQALRHMHVSRLIAAGLDVVTISRRIGHASPAITLPVYWHLFANTDARAAEIMEATFAKVRTDREPSGGNPVAI